MRRSPVCRTSEMRLPHVAGSLRGSMPRFCRRAGSAVAGRTTRSAPAGNRASAAGRSAFLQERGGVKNERIRKRSSRRQGTTSSLFSRGRPSVRIGTREVGSRGGRTRLVGGGAAFGRPFGPDRPARLPNGWSMKRCFRADRVRCRRCSLWPWSRVRRCLCSICPFRCTPRRRLCGPGWI